MKSSVLSKCRALALIPAVVVGLLSAACQVTLAQTPPKPFTACDAQAKALLAQ